MTLRLHGHVKLLDKLKCYILTSTRPVITKNYLVVASDKGQPTTSSYNTLITWSLQVTWQMRNLIFTSSRSVATKRKLEWLFLRRFNHVKLCTNSQSHTTLTSQSHVTLTSQSHVRICDKRKMIQLNFCKAYYHQTKQMGDL